MKRLHKAAVCVVVGMAILGLGLTSLGQDDSDCWCAQYVGLRDDVPTRGSFVLLRIAASAALTGLTYWGVDYFGIPNAQAYKASALLSGASSTALALADLALPTQRSIERDGDRIAESTLSEDLCAKTLTSYYTGSQAHRYLSGTINIASGIAQVLLFSPNGTYATGQFWDYLFYVTGGLDIIGGLINFFFPPSFERDFREALEICGF